MEFKFRYKVKPSDLWQFYMYYAYSSYLCIINIICIVSSVALLIKLWATSPGWFRGLLLLFFSLFTVIQPISIYLRARKQAANYQDETELVVNDDGVTVTQNGKTESRKWNQILQVNIKPTMVVLYTDREHGYILTGRILKKDKKALVQFIKGKRSSKK